MQIKADKYISLLRLFKVGIVHYNSYNLFSSNILPPYTTGKITQFVYNNTTTSPYFIKKSDERRLSYFFKKFNLPEDVYNNFDKKVNHITIAFDRYSEALLENTSTERKIANLIMGLEALFSNDSIELSFKLSTRTSKIISISGSNPLQIKKDLKLAYSIRSNFSHGGHLSNSDKIKIEEKYGSVDIFLHLISNYLRIGLIIIMNSDLNKDDLINLIDDSFISDIKNKELKLHMKKIRLLIWN